MADTLRLSDIAGQALDLASDSQLLADIGALGQIWPKLSAGLAAIEGNRNASLAELFGWLLAHIDDDNTTTAFAAIGADALLAKLRAAKARLLVVLPGAPNLLAPAGTPAGKISWQPGKLDVALAPAQDLSLSLKLGGELTFQAGVEWPYKGDELNGKFVLLDASGTLSADASFKMPFSLGSLGATTSGGVSPDLAFYIPPQSPTQLLAEALAQAVPHLPDPFDPGSVWRAFASHGLAGMVMSLDAHASVSVSLALGKDFDVPSWVTGNLGATVTLEVARQSAWQLSLHALSPATGVSDPVLGFALSQSTITDQDVAAGLGLTFDASPIFAQVHALLLADLAKVNDGIVAQITPFLTPGTWLRTHALTQIDVLIGEITNNAVLQPALMHDAALLLGATPTTQDLTTLLQDRLTAALDSAQGVATAETASVVSAISAQLASALPSLAASGVASRLQSDLAALLASYRNALGTLADTLLASPLAAIEASFAKIGTELTAVAQGIDKATARVAAGIQDIITRYQALAQKIVDFTGDQAKAKIIARISYDARRTQQTKYEVVGTFTSMAGPAGALYQALAFGQLSWVRKALGGGMAGFTLNEAASSITDLINVKQTLGYEVLLFGLDLTGQNVLSVQAEVTARPNGTITVGAQGSFATSMQSLGASRSLSFATSYDLLRARTDIASGRPTIRLGLTATQADKALTLQDVTGFLAGLAQFGLVSDARCQQAASAITGWATTRGKNASLGGGVQISQNLDADDIKALLATGQALADTPSPSPQRLTVFRQAAQCMFRTGASSPHDLHGLLSDFDSRQEVKNLRAATPDDIAFAYTMNATGRWRQYLIGLQTGGPRELPDPRIGEMFELADPLLDAVDLLARLFTTYTYDPTGKDVQTASQFYTSAQGAIASDAAPWLRLHRKWLFSFDQKLHPRTLALFLFLATQARGLSPDDDAHQFDDMFTITLTPDGSTPIIV